MASAALIVDGLFSAAGLIPSVRPTRADIFSSIKIDYKLFTNILGVAIFATLFMLTKRRGATDPVCGMKVDKAKALHIEFGEETFYFCSEHCLHAFEVNPHSHSRARAGSEMAAADGHPH
jgi:YHS domain-containing protein